MSFAAMYASFKLGLNIFITWAVGWIGNYGDIWFNNLINQVPNERARQALHEVLDILWPFIQPLLMASGARKAYLILQTTMMPVWLKVIFLLPYLLYSLPHLSSLAKAVGA